MTKLLKLPLFALFSVFLMPSLSAQSAEISTVSFRTLGLTRGSTVDLYFSTDKGFESLPLQYFRQSTSHVARLTREGTLPLFSLETTPEGETQYVLHSQIAVPSGSRQILLLAADSANEVRFKAVNDNLGANYKDWLYINTTQVPVAIQLGDGNRPKGVPAGQSVFHQIDLSASERGAAVRVAAYREENWERVYSRFWPIYDNQRTIVIFIEQNDRIRVVNFHDAVRRPD